MYMQANVNPVYISPGHLTDLESVVNIVKLCSSDYKLPEPLHQADMIARKRVKFFED